MTEFRFEVDFGAPSVAAIFEAYFDAELSVEQDRRTGVARREVLELDDGADVLRRVCRVVPVRQVPAVVRPFVRGEVSYTERLTWTKTTDTIAMSIEPSLAGSRIDIAAVYRVVPITDGVVRRTYAGHVTVQLHLLGTRIERAIIEDLGRSLEAAAACTQEWLDKRGTTQRF